MKKSKVYFISILISVATGVLSALATMNSMDIYESINTPPLSPPAILFPIVWSILYVLMGVSAARIFLSIAPATEKTTALFTYGVSLFVNFFFSIFFFNMRLFTLSFVWILLLWILVLLTVLDYLKVDKIAAYLQIPYLLWVTFATYLTLFIAILN
jgi:tryptophan-rich sensory protein